MEYEKEITVEVSCSVEKLKSILEKYDFKIMEEYNLYDVYMVEKRYKNENNYLELLKKCVLVRNIVEKDKETKMITYKKKEYDEHGDILTQSKINCKIESTEDAILLLESINYQKLITIDDHLIVMANKKDELVIQLVNNKHIYIEIEDKCNFINKKYSDIDEMKKVIVKYNIPMKENNYFVKKAEIELNEKTLKI